MILNCGRELCVVNERFIMSVFGRSNSFVCLTLHCRMRNTHTRHLCRLIPCGSCVISSGPRFKTSPARNLCLSAVIHEKESLVVNRSCSSAESSFRDMLRFRREEAKHSVLFELSSRIDIPCILKLCKAYGDVKNTIAFTNKKSKFQVLAEFMNEESVQKLLSDSSIKYATEGFPCQSRCLRFENSGKQRNHTTVAPGDVTELSFGNKTSVSKQPSSVSEMMMELYQKEKMSELSIRLRFLSSVLIEDILKGMFPHCITFPFGSSTNGYGKDSSDLDIMLRLFPEQVSKNPEVYLKTRNVKGNSHALQRYAVHVIGDILQTFVPGVYSVQKIHNARIPIVKYACLDFNLDCDVSVNNMSAVYMTEILFYCGELDPRIRPLIYTIKKWARNAGITFKDPGPSLTNFSLILLVLFFLQSRPVPILPPLYRLVSVPDPDDYRASAVKYVHERNSSNLKSVFTGQRNTESLDVLLQEFCRFLATFPFKEQRISIIGAVSNPNRGGYPVWIDYPMNESKNVAKNVSSEEMKNLREAALTALKNLENLGTSLKTTDLMSVLGLSPCAQGISDKIDVRAFLDVNSQPEEAITHGR